MLLLKLFCRLVALIEPPTCLGGLLLALLNWFWRPFIRLWCSCCWVSDSVVDPVTGVEVIPGGGGGGGKLSRCVEFPLDPPFLVGVPAEGVGDKVPPGGGAGGGWLGLL